MPDLFGLDIAGIVSDALATAGGLPVATLIKVTPGTRTAGDLAGGTNATTARYPTTGIAEPGSDRDFSAGAGWQATERARCTISLVGKALTDAGVAPAVDDQIEIANAQGVVETWTIKVQDPDGRDPAAAMYVSICVGA